jgi:predicted DNA-binding antitoxin AbrB/MazE fold protein
MVFLKKFAFVVIFLSLNSTRLMAMSNVVFPKNGDTLNYTQIMFEFEEVPDASYYYIEVVNTRLNEIVILKKVLSLAQMLSDKFQFGETYKWRYMAFKKNHVKLTESPFVLFHIKQTKWCCKDYLNLQSTTFNKKKSYRGYIIYDFGVVADKKGTVIWNLPQTNGAFRNLNLNRDGTFTYNNQTGSYEINLQGNLTWQGPYLLADSTRIKNYHHDIKKLSNGNFLCLAERDTIIGNNVYTVAFEITRNNQIIWFWDELFFYKDRGDSVNSNHVNSIYMDEKNNAVYLSNRNLNSITKLSLTHKPIATLQIGNGYKNPSIQYINHQLFSGQHAVSITPYQTIVLFNNNTAHKGMASSVIELRIPKPTDTALSIIWQYPFHFKNAEENFCAKSGDADILPNGNILITSGANNRVFEVTKGKKMVWENLSYRRDKKTDEFTVLSSYRSHFCSSLYPTYFTIQHTHSKHKPLTIKINNDGSENDNYMLQILEENGAYKVLKSIPLKSGEQKRVTLPIQVDYEKLYTIKVTSTNNPLKSKQIIISPKSNINLK